MLPPPPASRIRHAAFERLARLAAAACGARVGAVTLLRDDALRVAGGYALPEDIEPGEECRRIVATGLPVLTGHGYAGVPVLSADGTVLGTVCVFGDIPAAEQEIALLQDVAASVLAELELASTVEAARREQRIGAAVLDAATDCVVRIDATGVIVGWSPSAQRTFGHDEAGAVGRSLIAVLAPPDLADAYGEGLAEILASEAPERHRLEVQAIHRDGRTLPVEIAIVPAGADGFVVGLRDLTELRAAERRVEFAERRFRALVEHVPATTYSCDYDAGGNVHYMSPQVEELTGLPAEHFLGDPRKWLDITHPDDRDRVAREIQQTLHAERPSESEYRIVATDGTVRWVWDRETIVRDTDGRPVYGQGVVVDMTPLREAQERLGAAERQLESIIRVAPMILGVMDRDGIVTYAEGRGLEAAGIQPEQIIGRHVAEITPGEAAARAIERALAGETSSANVFDGTSSFDVTWQPVVDDDGDLQGIVAVGVDVTDHRRSEAHLRHLAQHDSLTGAPNRGRLEQEITDRAGRGGEVAAVVVDVDGFKTVNDSLGHAAGDEVLRELARRLRVVAHEHGAFLARPGADEFTMLINDDARTCLRTAATELGEAALAAVREPIAEGGSEFVVSATAGVAVGAPVAGELLRHADVALGEAKRRGVPLAFYAGENGDARGRLTLTARIRAALANREFALFYQPVFDLTSGHVSGVEGLIRWHDPERGLVSPDDFIPAAEASGLIDDIGRWVVDESCRQSRVWADEGLFPAVGFNVAPRELRRDDFVSCLVESAHRHGTDLRKLVVEITERAAMREPERTDAVLRELKAAGVRVAIDDFGADHSSLARLRDLDVDVLKIDRSFLAGVPERRDASAIVSAILSLAAALGMDAVAEGVETAEQLEFLDRKRCRRVQGYHVGCPMPAEETTEFLRRHGPPALHRVA